MRFITTLIVLLGMAAKPVRADGGTLQISEKTNGYQLSVFTSPSPLRAGPVDVSVLVQSATTGEVLPDAAVQIHLTKLNSPSLTNKATHQAATNKLLQAAQIELPEAGQWTLTVDAEGEHGLACVKCQLEVAEPLPRWRELWPWFAWPALPIVLFCIIKTLTPERSSDSERERS
jgi:hypothetical protein